jgi:hypothetical protein
MLVRGRQTISHLLNQPMVWLYRGEQIASPQNPVPEAGFPCVIESTTTKLRNRILSTYLGDPKAVCWSWGV